MSKPARSAGWRWAWGASLVALVVGLSPRARAQPSAPDASRSAPVSDEAVRFDYAAPPPCPTWQSFVARLRQRTTRLRLVGPQDPARVFTVRVSAEAGGFVGSVEFLDDGGAPVSRKVRGEQCDAVVDSLALITALALDSALRSEEPASPEPGESPPASSPATPPVLAPNRPPQPVPSSHLPAPPTPLRVVPRRALTRARVGVSGAFDSDVAAPQLGVLGQLDFQRASLRLLAHYAARTTSVDAGRRARLRLIGVQTSGCPWRLQRGVVAFEPCLDLDWGTLRAEGLPGGRLLQVSGKTIFWASGGPELRLQLGPELAFPLWLELRLALGFPLVSHVFRFAEPPKDVYQVPRVTAAAGLAAGVRF